MKTGFTCGAFDLLHAGHVLMLEEAKSFEDFEEDKLFTSNAEVNNLINSLFKKEDKHETQ